MNNEILVNGMHCASCKVILETKISEIKGVKSVIAEIKTGKVLVEGKYDTNAVHRVITDLGYEIGLPENGFLSKKPGVYALNLASLFVVMGVVFAFSKLEKLGLGVAYGNGEMTLSIALLLGIAAGISTCMALTGSIVLAISSRYRELHPEISRNSLVISQLNFNLGRIIGFGIFGALLGLLGKSIAISPQINAVMIIIIGLYMLFVGIQLSGISPELTRLQLNIFSKLKIPQSLSSSGAGPFIAGVLTFFLPCGFTQLVQVAAITSGNPVGGALVLAVFAIGTAPGLIFVGSSASVFRGKSLKIFYSFVAMVLIIAALFNISTAAGIFGINLSTTEGTSVSVNKNYQEIRITADSNGYSPNKISIKQGVPVRLIIDAKERLSCANYFVIPSLKINTVLNKGENVVEFTPENIGEIVFSCSMGMYSGQFIVK